MRNLSKNSLRQRSAGKATVATLVAATLGMGGVVLWAGHAQAAGGSSNAQSIMVDTQYESGAYQIEPTITWAFGKACAAAYYTANAGSFSSVSCSAGGPNNINCAAGNQPATPAAPAPPATGPNSIDFHAQSDRCVFFTGGTLTGWSYTQQVQNVSGLNGKGQWTFTYNYTTDASASVEAKTCWTSTEGGTLSVDVPFTGFVSSESYQLQSTRSKYSFTLVDASGSRAKGVTATLESSTDGGLTWVPVSSMDLNNIDTDLDTVNDSLAIVGATADFNYYANGGVFGTSVAALAALHAPGGKPVNGVVNILNGLFDGSPADNFLGNNNDLAAGNVHVAPFGGTWFGVTGDPNVTVQYRTRIDGTIKGNTGTAAPQSFSVESTPIIIGGC